MSQSPVDLSMLAHQQQRILSEVGQMRDDMAVMMAILQRLDGTVAGLVNEVRAIHGQQSRMGHRLRTLEDARDA